MQRVVRFSLAGALTIAGLTACGDKVTVPPPVQQTVDSVVHSVTVSPPSATIAVGGKIILAASVDAGAGVSNRTVTWSTSDATVATVGTDGTVTGVKAGTVSITASAVANPAVKGASAITVGGGGGGPVTVLISAINQNGLPANLAAAAGQLDVVLDVDAGGQALKSVQATLTCGKQTMTRTQTISAAAPVSADAAQATVTLSFPTAEFNPTTGVPTLLNGPCTISASATTAGGTQSATNSQTLTLANQDVVVVTPSFSGGSTATDKAGVPWKSGALTVSALPVLYSGRTVSTVTVGLNGVDPVAGTQISKTVTVSTPTSGAFSASFPNATSGGSASARIGQITLAGSLYDALGVAAPVTPTVVAIDNQGNEVGLANANPAASSFRLDNQSPNAPTIAQIPPRQQGWINGTYTFTGTGGASTATKYVSGNDNGVSNGTVSGSTGLTGNTTFTYYVMAASGYPGNGLTNGTQVGAANCPTTGWTQVATGGDLAESANNQQYVVRIVEADKLGNVRCTDVGTGVGTGSFAVAMFGVDKTPPNATLLSSSDQAGAADPNQQINIAQPAVPSFIVSLSDNASGFSTTPLLTTVTRLAINPATGVASTPTDAGGFGCPTGLDGNGACSPVATTATVAGDYGTGGQGYFTFTSSALDLARNTTVVKNSPRTILIDKTAPVVGGLQVPAAIKGGTSVSFATSASDNLDLVSTDYTLSYNVAVGGNAAPFNIRASGPSLGTAFDNVLTTAASFSLSVPSFIRSVTAVDVNGTPTAGPGALANNITVRAYDAAGNVSNPGVSAINPLNIDQTSPTNFAALQSNGAQFQAFGVTTPATAVSDCPQSGCAGGANPANPTTVNLTAAAIGSEGATFQFLNPFTSVQFYFFNPNTSEWTLAGSTTAPVVTDDATSTHRTFTWTLAGFKPLPGLPAGPLKIIAVGVNAAGDALASNFSSTVTLTNP